MSKFPKGTPPLPVVEDVQGIISFFLTSLDDLAEDCVKLAIILGVVMLFFNYIIPRLQRNNSLFLLSFFLVMLLFVYPPVNELGDQVGDQVNVVQNRWLVFLGYKKKKIRMRSGRLNKKSSLLQTIDDVVEDGFKLGCVGSHLMIGNMLRSAIIANPGTTTEVLRRGVYSGSWRFARATAGLIIVAGAPAKSYQQCDQYADKLGDWAQSQVYKLIG
jgi:hypothetical protein